MIRAERLTVFVRTRPCVEKRERIERERRDKKLVVIAIFSYRLKIEELNISINMFLKKMMN